jgi:pimeloyl-ACP methyl ester carboxylesterase
VAPTIVCLHGLRRSPGDWAGVRASLEPSWTVDAPSLPADPDAALIAADAAIRPGDIVFAHSLGAVVATRLLAEHPRPLTALVLSGSFFPPARNGRTLSASVLDYGRHRAALARELTRRADERVRTERSRRALTSLLRQAARTAVPVVDPATPVLVVHARDDHHVPVDFAIAAVAQRPAWTLSLIDRGGHHLHADHPDAWLSCVLPWLTMRRSERP